MSKAWVDVKSYFSIIEQAAKNDGKAIIESRWSDPLEITIDPEYAKKEWAEIERIINKFNETVI